MEAAVADGQGLHNYFFCGYEAPTEWFEGVSLMAGLVS